MTINRVKTPGRFPFNRFESRQGKVKLKAEIYDDLGGWFEVRKGSTQLLCREDATIPDWIDDVQTEISNLNMLLQFLKKVQHNQRLLKNKP